MSESTSSDVGLVLGSQDATPLEFWVGVREGERLQLDDLVVAKTTLSDGDQVTLVKDLAVKGTGKTLKRGTVIKSIRLTDDA